MNDRKNPTYDLVHRSRVWICDTINVSRECQPITDADVIELAADLKAHGQRERVGVVPITHIPWLDATACEWLVKEGHWFALVYGFRRMHALQIAGIDTVKIEIAHDLRTVDAIELANLSENWGHKPPTEYQLTWATHRMVTARKVSTVAVAQSINRRLAWVDESVRLVDRVHPDLLAHYRVMSTAAVRRKMVALAQLDAPYNNTLAERHRLQHAQWATWEQDEAAARRTDPHGGIAPKPANRHQQHSRQDLRVRLRAVLDDPALTDEQRLFRIRAMVQP